jgi:DhnA family fructose-bisphosphate aldolase class Ia
VKSYYTGDPDSFREVVDGCPVPVVILGGEKTESIEQVFTEVFDSLRAGAAGVAVGRNVWQHPDPRAMVEAMVGIVHEGWTVTQALGHL